MEDPPLSGRPRWYCYPRSFHTPEKAVAWALESAPTVIVRTNGDRQYWAGDRPQDWPRGSTLRPWPPPAEQRREIEREHEERLVAAKAEAAAREAYAREREQWMGVGRAPVREWLVVLPDGEWGVELDQLDADGEVYAARRMNGGPTAFGAAAEVLAATSRQPADDPWVQTMLATLEREQAREVRRSRLLVKLGNGEMFHVTPSVNRDSIQRHGLDWQRMAVTRGIAGSGAPELEGVFLCATRGGAQFFVDMGREPTDVWAVDVTGLWLEGAPDDDLGGGDSWLVVCEPIPADRVRLVERDLRSTR